MPHCIGIDRQLETQRIEVAGVDLSHTKRPQLAFEQSCHCVNALGNCLRPSGPW